MNFEELRKLHPNISVKPAHEINLKDAMVNNIMIFQDVIPPTTVIRSKRYCITLSHPEGFDVILCNSSEVMAAAVAIVTPADKCDVQVTVNTEVAEETDEDIKLANAAKAQQK